MPQMLARRGAKGDRRSSRSGRWRDPNHRLSDLAHSLPCPGCDRGVAQLLLVTLRPRALLLTYRCVQCGREVQRTTVEAAAPESG